MNFFFCKILGSGGVMPTRDRNVTSIYCKTLKSTFLLDMGQNAQKKILQNGFGFFLDFIVLSHHHLDHFLGVLGYLNSLNLLNRTSPLKIYCPSPDNLRGVFFALKGPRYFETLSYQVVFVKMVPQVVYEQKDLTLQFVKANHTVLTYQVIITSKDNLKYDKKGLSIFTPEQVKTLMINGSVTKQLKLYKKQDFVLSDKPYFKVVYSGDTYWDPRVLDYHDTVILHECTHLNKDQLVESKKTLHTNFSLINDLSKLDQNNNHLVLVHLGPRINVAKSAEYNKKINNKRLLFARDNSFFQIHDKQVTKLQY